MPTRNRGRTPWRQPSPGTPSRPGPWGPHAAHPGGWPPPMSPPRGQSPPPTPAPARVHIEGMDHLVFAISDLPAAVNALVAVEQQVADILPAPKPPAGTVLTAED